MEAIRTTEDLYPSRQGAEARILPRQDAVVYGGEQGGPLSAEQLAFFDEHGYLLLHGLFDRQEVQRFQEAMGAIFGERRQDPSDEVIREPDSEIVRSVFRVHDTSTTFRQVCRDPRLLGLANQLLGGEVYIHHSRINYKPGYHGRQFDWHSDFETWHMEDGIPRMRALSFSVALTENNAHNGPLMVIPGSHRHYVSCPGETPDENYKSSLRKQVYGVPDAASLDYLVEHSTDALTAAYGEPGTVLVFDSNIMHGSNSNISPFPRSVLYFVYNSVHNTPGAPFNGKPPRPHFLRNTDFTPLRPVQ